MRLLLMFFKCVMAVSASLTDPYVPLPPVAGWEIVYVLRWSGRGPEFDFKMTQKCKTTKDI